MSSDRIQALSILFLVVHCSTLDVGCANHPPDNAAVCRAVPQAPAPPPSSEMVKAEVPQQQQAAVAAPAALKDVPSIKNEPLDWEWFLRQSSLEPLLDDPNLLRGF